MLVLKVTISDCACGVCCLFICLDVKRLMMHVEISHIIL